jgi:chaperonin GroES
MAVIRKNDKSENAISCQCQTITPRRLQFLHFPGAWHTISLPLRTCQLLSIGAGTTLIWHSFIKQKFIKMANKVNVTPLHDRVIVKPAAAEEKTAGGIIIPDTAKEKPQRGTVIAAGPGKKDEPVTVKEGDTVLYGKYAGTEISIEGDDLLIMRESDILAIV